jgi:hypothetical protein
MTPDAALAHKLDYIVRIVRKECRHLLSTDQRLFRTAFTIEMAAKLETDPDLSERVEAFSSRFGRLQDTVGDKLLPLTLRLLGERAGAAIDNLDRAERLGLVRSVEEWMLIRRLRNQMVHEYVEDLNVLTDALQGAHDFVPTLVDAANALISEIERRK